MIILVGIIAVFHVHWCTRAGRLRLRRGRQRRGGAPLRRQGRAHPHVGVRARVDAGGAGGIIAAARLFAVNQSSGGSDLLLLAIAGPVVAGTSLFGGRGTVWAALLGALVIGSISNGMDLLALESWVKFMVTGGCLSEPLRWTRSPVSAAARTGGYEDLTGLDHYGTLSR